MERSVGKTRAVFGSSDNTNYVNSPFDEATHELILGWKGEFGDGYVLELGLLENAFVVDNSPDVGFHLGLSKRF